MTEFSWRTRLATLTRLQQDDFDVLIIGGGITGAGLALDAAARGFKTALVEKRDFAAGTSSRSTKLIHGGLRYLEHFDFALVREGLRERALLTRLAPHLNEPFPFVIPIYESAPRNYDHPLKMRAGMILYDLLAGRYKLQSHSRISREQALQLAPQLDARGLKGAFVYHDALTDDARLVIAVIKSAHERGAVIANYVCVTGFLQAEAGQVRGVQLRDELTGAITAARARQVINATGVWMEETLSLSEGTSGIPAKTVRPSKGIHLTVSAERLRVTTAWLIPALTGHRFYFVVPWQGFVNIGTTDTDYQGDKDAPRAEADEIREVLGAINSYFPGAQLEPADIISSWAGLRPLISDPLIKSTTAISRREELLESPDGVISLAGGKLTTYRLMAERGMNLAAKRLQKRFGVRAVNGSQTEDICLSGALARKDIAAAVRQLEQEERLPPEVAQHLVKSYGTEAARVAAIAREAERLRAPLMDGVPHIAAEVIYAIRNEMALTLADVLARRIRLLLLAGARTLTCAAVTADLMAREMDWDEAATQRQIQKLAEEYESEYQVIL